jgi:hypothetical protein
MGPLFSQVCAGGGVRSARHLKLPLKDKMVTDPYFISQTAS